MIIISGYSYLVSFSMKMVQWKPVLTLSGFHYITSKIGSRKEVSNTRPAGRMWPARCICAARAHPKKPKNYKFWSNLAYFESFSCNLRPAKAFYNKLRPAEYFFFEMWPSDEFEFETPALEVQSLVKLTQERNFLPNISF